MLTVQTYSADGIQRGISLRPRELRFSTQYPGGYASCTFDLPGRHLGWDYSDIGYFYRVRVYDGLTEVWDGEIRVIDERTGAEPGFTITAFGYSILAGDDVYTRVWSDDRLGNWTFHQDDLTVAAGGYNPPFYEHHVWATELYLQAVLNATFVNGDYAVLRYELPKDSAGTYVSEMIEKIVFTHQTAIGSGTWTLDLYDRTNTARCRTAAGGGGAEWTVTTTVGATATTLYPPVAASCKKVEFRLTAGAANTPGNTVIFAKITGVYIYTTTGNIYADDVAKHILSSRLDESGLGLATTQTRINSGSTFSLNPTYFADKEITCREALDWICSFGNQDNKQLAWGVWEDKTLWLEIKPTDTVHYRVHPFDAQELRISGSVEEILLKTYAIYEPAGWRGSSTDTAIWEGWQRTAEQTSAQSANRYGSRYRRHGIQVNHTMDSAQAAQVATVALADRDRPRVQSSITLRRNVFDSAGSPVPLAEVRAGKLIEIPNLRAREAESLGGNDLRDSSTIFLIAATEYDAEAGTLTITPDGARQSLVRLLARLQMMDSQ